MMEAESQEIENLKFKINDLSTKLIKLDISKEIKEKIESLLFLLNKKKLLLIFKMKCNNNFNKYKQCNNK